MMFTVRNGLYDDYSETIKAYRNKHGLSQQQLAVMLGMERQAVSKWENGLSKPSFELWKSFLELVKS